MATKAGTPNKRSWQQPQRPVFDEHSRKVWRLLISVLALVMIAIAGIAYWMSFKPPPRSFLISITDDRKEFATVPPVPMLEQDEAALKGWAQSTKVPVLFRKLSAIASPKTFCSNLFSPPAGSATGGDGGYEFVWKSFQGRLRTGSSGFPHGVSGQRSLESSF